MQNFMRNFVQKNIFYIATAVDLLTFDFLSKFIAESWLPDGKSVQVIKGILQLRVSHNDAIAFSLPVPGRLVAYITPLLLAALIYFIVKTCDMTKKIPRVSMALIVAGTLGNFIDRVYHGYVVDFISFSFFPSFNLADACLTIGVMLLLVGSRGISNQEKSAAL